jgi:hypothetical protein
MDTNSSGTVSQAEGARLLHEASENIRTQRGLIQQAVNAIGTSAQGMVEEQQRQIDEVAAPLVRAAGRTIQQQNKLLAKPTQAMLDMVRGGIEWQQSQLNDATQAANPIAPLGSYVPPAVPPAAVPHAVPVAPTPILPIATLPQQPQSQTPPQSGGQSGQQPQVPPSACAPDNSGVPVDTGQTLQPPGLEPACNVFQLWEDPTGGCVVVNPAYFYDPSGQGPIIPNYPSIAGNWVQAGVYDSAVNAWAQCGGPPGNTGGGPGNPPAGGTGGGTSGSGGTTGGGATTVGSCPLPDPCAPVVADPPVDPGLPPPTCPTAVAQSIGLPAPGSIGWCNLQQQIKDAFVNAGLAIVDSLDRLITTGGTDGLPNLNIDSALQDISPLKLAAALPRIVLQIAKQYGLDFIQYVKQALDCARYAVINTGWANPAEFLALVACKTVITAFEEFAIGFNLGVQGSVTIGVILKPIDDVLNALIRSAIPVEIPTVGEAIEAYNHGWIGETQYRCWVNLNGHNPEVIEPIRLSSMHVATPHEAIQYVRRTTDDPGTLTALLVAAGYPDAGQRNILTTLYDELPSISDHLHWLQRNVFDTQYVTDFNLLEGFEDKFWPAFGADLYAQGLQKKYAALHYAAHWQIPAPGQLAEMMQRLRPGRVADKLSLASDQYLRLLAEQDVAPYFRERFKAIAFQQPNLTQVTSLFETSQIDGAELVERLQDLGYNKDDATTISDQMAIQKARRRASQGHGWTPSAMASGFALSLVPADLVSRQMSAQGFTPEETQALMQRASIDLRQSIVRRGAAKAITTATTTALNAYKVGTVDRGQAGSILTSIGYSGAQSVALLDAHDMAEHVARVTGVIKSARKDYLNARISSAQATVVLEEAGITSQRIAEYLQEWGAEFTPAHRTLAAGKVQSLLKRGLISVTEARMRLTVLGYGDPDTQLLIDESEQSIQEAERKLHDAEAKQLAKQGAALQKSAQAQQAQLKKTQQALKTVTPVGKMIDWYSRGITNEPAFVSRLLAMGYDQQSTDSYLVEAKQKRQERQQTLAKQAAALAKSGTKEATVAQILKWYSIDLVDDTLFTTLVTDLGYPKQEVDLFLKQAQEAKAKTSAKTQPVPAATPPAGGP